MTLHHAAYTAHRTGDTERWQAYARDQIKARRLQPVIDRVNAEIAGAFGAKKAADPC